jgi:hypothetical protein
MTYFSEIHFNGMHQSHHSNRFAVSHFAKDLWDYIGTHHMKLHGVTLGTGEIIAFTFTLKIRV